MAKKPKAQGEFAGFRPQSIVDVDEAADEYQIACDAHKAAGEARKKAAEELAARMAKYNVPMYRLDDENVLVLQDTRTVSLKKIKSLRQKGPQEGDATAKELVGE